MKSVAVVFVIAWFYLTRKLIYTRFWKHSKWDLRFSLPCTILCVVKSFQIGLSVKSKVTYLHLTEKKVIFALLWLYKKVGIKYLRKELSGRKKGTKVIKARPTNLQYIVQFANGVIGLTLDGVTKVICA